MKNKGKKALAIILVLLGTAFTIYVVNTDGSKSAPQTKTSVGGSDTANTAKAK
jgi:hypothetical protein